MKTIAYWAFFVVLICGAIYVMHIALSVPTGSVRLIHHQRGPIDALIDHMPVCAATKQDTGSRIVLDGVLRGPCNSTDVGRKP